MLDTRLPHSVETNRIPEAYLLTMLVQLVQGTSDSKFLCSLRGLIGLPMWC